jgi:hypothetical protein
VGRKSLRDVDLVVARFEVGYTPRWREVLERGEER